MAPSRDVEVERLKDQKRSSIHVTAGPIFSGM
jgi:hypothetical protein